MSKLCFTKYHGAGNDFILIDDRALLFNPQIVPLLCHRKFGIGADGVILLQEDERADFRMRIYNADGKEAESCGNGLRCLMKFAIEKGLRFERAKIATLSGVVEAQIYGDKVKVALGKVGNVKRLYISDHEVFSLHVGVPHAVLFSEEPLEKWGPYLHDHPLFSPEKTNVNIAQIQTCGVICVRVFERGVGETLACGTGAAAVGYIASKIRHFTNPIRISMQGGPLQIDVEEDKVFLTGGAIKVFEGILPKLSANSVEWANH